MVRSVTAGIGGGVFDMPWDQIRCDEGGSDAIRLETLKSYDILDTPNEAEFDEIVAEAVVALGTPIALISLLDERRQWFKARLGVDRTETDRSVSFCEHTIRGSGVFCVQDTQCDPRFVANPLVTGDPGVRFYAGAPLVAPDGMRIGTLCVIDNKPHRALAPEEQVQLVALAERAMKALEDRKRKRASPPDASQCYGRDR
jgi:GAF domain-containing protein